MNMQDHQKEQAKNKGEIQSLLDQEKLVLTEHQYGGRTLLNHQTQTIFLICVGL